MGFKERSIAHEQYCEEVVSVIESKDFKAIPFGIEHRFSTLCRLQLLEHRTHKLSKFVRFVPDYILIAGSLSFFDVKSPSQKWRTISIELDAVDNYRTLDSVGMPVFIVAHDYLTFWARDILFSRVFDDMDKLRSVSGSKTPFGIVDLEKTSHRPLGDFLWWLKGGE